MVDECNIILENTCCCSGSRKLFLFSKVFVWFSEFNFCKMNCQTTDINECALSTDNCASPASGGLCTNIVGSFTCSCITGYTGNGIICSGKKFNHCLNIVT